MAFDYARMQAVGERLIANFGFTATLRRPTSTGPAHDPTPAAPDDHAVKIVVTDYENKDIDGTRILATDKKMLMSAIGLAIQPALSDQVLDGDAKPYKIVAVKPMKPANVVVFYELQCRR